MYIKFRQFYFLLEVVISRGRVYDARPCTEVLLIFLPQPIIHIATISRFRILKIIVTIAPRRKQVKRDLVRLEFLKM
jgi:hypothetical protein